MIKFQRSFTTPDEIQTVQATVITYMQSIGYQLKKDDNGLRFRRGSSFGVFYSSKAKNLKTDCQVVLKRLNTYQTEVSLFFDVQVAESYDTDRNRKQWLAEMDGLVKASGGTVDPNSPVNIQGSVMENYRLERGIRNGSSWFYLIGGLSILNSILYIFDANLMFVVGTGITQLVDVIAGYLAAELLGTAGSVIRVLGLLISIAISGIFILFGYLGRKKYKWAFIAGIILYSLDGVLMLVFSEYYGLIVHLIAIIGLIGGLTAITKYQRNAVQLPTPMYG